MQRNKGGLQRCFFADMRKAYYSVLLELVLGPLLTEGEREVVLRGAGMDELRQYIIQHDVGLGQYIFSQLGIPGNLAEWQRLA